MAEIVRENDYIYITKLSKDGWYNARMKRLSISRVGNDLDKLELEFTQYVEDLVARFDKK